MGLDGANEMVGVGVGVIGVGVFYAKIIDNKAKKDVACVVLPQTGCVYTGGVARETELLDKEIVGDAAGLWDFY
jgi:hypothetical protein